MQPATPMGDRASLLLEARDYDGLLALVSNPAYQGHVVNEGMDLITKICESGLAFAEDQEGTEKVAECLSTVVRGYKPKEALICLLEQAEAFVNSEKFTYILPPLQWVMISLPKKREKTLNWVLATLKSHIKYCHQIPEKLRTERVNGLVLEEDPVCRKVLTTYKEYVKFYSPFVHEWETKRKDAGDLAEAEGLQREREYLRDYLVDLLGVPLIHFHLDWSPDENENDATAGNENRVKTDGRLLAEDILGLIAKLDFSPSDYFQWIERRMHAVGNPERKSSEVDLDDDDEDEDDVVVHMSSLVTYLYLVLDQHLPGFESLRRVYSPTYMFNMMLYPVTTVLKNSGDTLALHKGIRLASKILEMCDTTPCQSGDFSCTHRLHRDLLKGGVHCVFVERICYLALYCQDAVIRKEAYQLFQRYLMTFDPAGKFDLIKFVLNMIPNDSLVGQVIHELKQFIHIATDPSHPKFEKGMEDCFLGDAVTRMILSVCRLSQGVTTDLCQNSNQIVAALNLLRYLLLRDKSCKKLNMQGIFPKIEESMLNPLRKGLDLSKAHYELKLKELNDPHLKKERESEEKRLFENLKCDMQIGGETVKAGDISLKEQRSSVVNALNTFDHMNGLLAWVYEAHTTTCKTS